MTDQELADEIQDAIMKAIELMTVAVGRTCELAGRELETVAAVPGAAEALGHLWIAHGRATETINNLPHVTPNFGSK